jgi:hypothetical protein
MGRKTSGPSGDSIRKPKKPKMAGNFTPVSGVIKVKMLICPGMNYDHSHPTASTTTLPT